MQYRRNELFANCPPHTNQITTRFILLRISLYVTHFINDWFYLYSTFCCEFESLRLSKLKIDSKIKTINIYF